jgi:tetratricopeptide (TPR) repeat protein
MISDSGQSNFSSYSSAELFDSAVDAYEAGDIKHARELAAQTLVLSPQHAGALFMLGSLELGTGDPSAAISHLEMALVHSPDQAVIWKELGSSYFAVRRWSDAVRAIQKAYAAGIRDSPMLNQLGVALKELEYFDAAAKAFYDALHIKPGDPDTYSNLAIVLNLKHDYLAAIGAYKKALELDPSRADLWSNLATLYEQANMLDEAEKALSRGLAIAPQQEHLHLTAAKSERRRGSYLAAAKRLESMLKNPVIEGSVRRAMEFELGRVHDLLGNTEQAYQHFLAANQQTKLLWPELYGPAQAYIKELEALAEFFDTDTLDSSPPPITVEEPQTKKLAFLVGFPRSGSTLLDTILGSHPDISVLEEEPFLNSIIETVRQSPAGYPWSLSKLAASDLDDLRSRYWCEVDRQLGEKTNTTLIVDKNPLFSAHAALIHLLFPQARFILMLRHPCDVILSCFMQPFGRNPVFANLGDLPTATRIYNLVMGSWLRCCRHLPLKVHVLRYENLVEDKAREIHTLLEFLETAWMENLSDHTAHARARGRIYTPSYHQVIQPVYRDALGRWKRYATHLAPIIESLRPLAENFGYELQV